MTEARQPPIDTLIHNATIVTCDDDGRIVKDGAMAVRGSTIVEVGTTDALIERWQSSAGEVVDASGCVVMPGLVNTHCHAADTLFRGLVDDLPLEPWLERLWRAERRFLRPETEDLGARLAVAEMIRGGITTVLDMFWFPRATAEVARETGFRLLTGPIFFDHDAPDGLAADDRLDDGRAFIEQYQDDPLVTPCIMPHSTYTVSPARLQAAQALADHYGVLTSTHASETAFEVQTVTEQHGDRPPALLDRLGMLSDRTVLAHCVHMDDGEMDLLAQRGTTVAHCPLSNLKLGSGVARVPAMKAAGVNVTLGTDGAVSGNDLDLWAAMRLGAVLHKGVGHDPSLIPARDVIGWATRDGARALGLVDRIGSLETGKDADLIVIDFNRPHLVPCFDVLSHLAYAVGRDDVTSSMVRGRWLMRDRQLQTLNEADTLERAHALGDEIARY